MKNYTIGFYLEKLYYSPQFEPVIKEIIKRNISYVVIIPKNRVKSTWRIHQTLPRRRFRILFRRRRL